MVGVNKKLSVEIPNAVDNYNVIGDFCISSSESQLDVPSYPFRPRFQVSSSTKSVQEVLDKTISSPCVTLSVKAVLPLLLTLKWGYFFLNSLCMQKDAENIDVCVQRKPSEYLNRKRMQEAIHAKLVGVTR